MVITAKPHSTPVVLEFVLGQLTQFKRDRPLVVGLSGPQGSGKSSVVRAVSEELTLKGLNVVQFSLDDVYLTHKEQVNLAKSGNTLLQQRGLPGTHDISLTLKTFKRLLSNQPTAIPQYEKSAFSGAGDRAPRALLVKPKYDVILFEGWCVGFTSVTDAEVATKWSKSPVLQKHSLDHIQEVNTILNRYLDIWSKFDAFVHLDAGDLNYIYHWRLVQEHQLIKTKGKGMTDQQVKEFVDGYMPGYELYNEQLRSKALGEATPTLRIRLGPDWKVLTHARL